MADKTLEVVLITSFCFSVIGIIALVAAFFKLRIHYKFLYKLDEHSTRHGGELVAEVLKVKFANLGCCFNILY
ncbi:hypothetical protein AC249_AIPGENE21610 [Exaiptasia diaphana]|nr:hypothetical protein AC249_AIPGENE21610 [Exaiptasia diaphana]